MKGYTIYTKSSGVEVSATTAKKEGNGEVRKEGRVMLRFFGFGEKDRKSIRFILNPVEAHWIYLKTVEISRNGGKESFPHKFTGENGEVITILTIEKWEREGKSGYAMNIKRGDDKVNISIDISHFLYTGELLRTLSTEQAWSQYKESEKTIEGEIHPTEEAATETTPKSAAEQTSEPTRANP